MASTTTRSPIPAPSSAAASLAVQFGVGTNLLQIGDGASFTGNVDGGGGGNNTLEFISGANSSFSNFSNFQYIDVDSGAAWTNTGSLSNLSGIHVGGTLTNANIIDGFVGLNATLGNSGVLINNVGASIAYGNIAVIGTGSINNAGRITSTNLDALYLGGSSSTLMPMPASSTIKRPARSRAITVASSSPAGRGRSMTARSRARAPGPTSIGIVLDYGGHLTNGGISNSAALISGYQSGAGSGSGGPATITNFGTIRRRALGSSASAYTFLDGGTISVRGTASYIHGNGGAIHNSFGIRITDDAASTPATAAPSRAVSASSSPTASTTPWSTAAPLAQYLRHLRRQHVHFGNSTNLLQIGDGGLFHRYDMVPAAPTRCTRQRAPPSGAAVHVDFQVTIGSTQTWAFNGYQTFNQVDLTVVGTLNNGGDLGIEGGTLTINGSISSLRRPRPRQARRPTPWPAFSRIPA